MLASYHHFKTGYFLGSPGMRYNWATVAPLRLALRC
jgi:hypothetical protein